MTPDDIAMRLRGRTALRLLHKLPAWLSTEEAVRLDQRSIARWLGTSQPVVSRALSEIAGAGGLLREGKGPGVRYRLSPHVTWQREERSTWPAGVAIITVRLPDRQLSGHELDSIRSAAESRLSSPPPPQQPPRQRRRSLVKPPIGCSARLRSSCSANWA